MSSIPLCTHTSDDRRKKRKRAYANSVLLKDILARVESADTTSNVAEQPSLHTENRISPDPPSISGKARESSIPAVNTEISESLRRLHIGGLAQSVKIHHLRAWLLLAVEESDIEELSLPGALEIKNTGSHRGFGFVVLRTSEAAHKVIQQLDDTTIRNDGSPPVRLSVARPKRYQHTTSERKGLKDETFRRFGSLSYRMLGEVIEKKHKEAVAAKVKAAKQARSEFLARKASKRAQEAAFVASGGEPPGGFGHGFTLRMGVTNEGNSERRPKLHSGYADFPME